MTDGQALLDLSLRGSSLEAQRHALTEALRERGISEASIATVMEHVRDGVALSGELPSGRSRFGGPGKLPVGTSWPSLRGKTYSGEVKDFYLGFLLEIALDEMPSVPLLPSDGTLLVFQEMEMFGLGYDLLEATRMFYVPAGAPTVSPDPPGDPIWALPQKPLGARAMPVAGEAKVVLRALDGCAEKDTVIKSMNDLMAGAMLLCTHWLLGSAVEVQGPVLEEVPYQLADLPQSSQRRFSAELLAGQGWTLLAQVGAEYDRENGLDFGIADGGSLYLCIPEDDLLRRHFGRVIGFVQSH